MKAKCITMMLCIVFFSSAALGWEGNQSDSGKKVIEAAGVLEEIFAIPEESIPPSLIKNAYAVVVIPSLIKAGFFVGGRYGSGLMMVRDKEDVWHYPVMVTLTGASVGWQIGAQSTDIILVLKTGEALMQ